MIVKWIQQRLLVTPLFKNSDNPKDLATTTTPQLVLYPGYNEVKEADWSLARPRLTDLIDSGDIIELADVKKGAEGKADKVIAKKLGDLDPKQAIKVVGETVSPETLKTWNSEEIRDGVLKVIRDRIQEIETKPTNTNEAMDRANRPVYK